MKLNLTTDYTTTTLVAQTAAEAQLRLTAGYDSANVLTKLDAARQLVEQDTNRSILNTVWTMKLDYFPSTIYLPKGRLVSVTSVKYLDSDNTEQTLVADTDYYVSGVGYDEGRIIPVSSWPQVSSDKNNSVEVVFTTGYGAAASTDTSWAEVAILGKLTDLYEGVNTNEIIYRKVIEKHILYFDYSLND